MDPGWFSGFFAVLAVMTFATTTNHMLFVTNALKGVDYQTIEAARNMGASTWTILRRIVLPMLKPTLFAVTVLSFLTGLGALSAPQVLGGRDFQTITPMILTFTQQPDVAGPGRAAGRHPRRGHHADAGRHDPAGKGRNLLLGLQGLLRPAEAADPQPRGQRRGPRRRLPAVRRVHPAGGPDRAVLLRRRRRDPDRTALPRQPDPGQLRPGAHPALGPAAVRHQHRLQRPGRADRRRRAAVRGPAPAEVPQLGHEPSSSICSTSRGSCPRRCSPWA